MVFTFEPGRFSDHFRLGFTGDAREPLVFSLDRNGPSAIKAQPSVPVLKTNGVSVPPLCIKVKSYWTHHLMGMRGVYGHYFVSSSPSTFFPYLILRIDDCGPFLRHPHGTSLLNLSGVPSVCYANASSHPHRMSQNTFGTHLLPKPALSTQRLDIDPGRWWMGMSFPVFPRYRRSRMTSFLFPQRLLIRDASTITSSREHTIFRGP